MTRLNIQKRTQVPKIARTLTDDQEDRFDNSKIKVMKKILTTAVLIMAIFTVESDVFGKANNDSEKGICCSKELPSFEDEVIIPEFTRDEIIGTEEKEINEDGLLPLIADYEMPEEVIVEPLYINTSKEMVDDKAQKKEERKLEREERRQARLEALKEWREQHPNYGYGAPGYSSSYFGYPHYNYHGNYHYGNHYYRNHYYRNHHYGNHHYGSHHYYRPH